MMSSYGQTKLTSTDTIGTTTAYGDDSPVSLAVAFDGSTDTYLDNNENWGFVGYDFGTTGATIDTFKYAPRASWASRMNGAVLRGSNSSNFLNDFDELYTISSDPTEGELTTAFIGSTTTYRYIYLFLGSGTYSNVSEIEMYDADGTELSGTIIGQEDGSEWCSTCTPDQAFDGDFDTYVEGPATIGFVGYDFGEGSEVTLTSWKYAPRTDYPGRMTGTELRGSNSLNYLSDYTVLATVSSEPSTGVLTQGTISDANSYRFVYWNGNDDSYANIAELELYYSDLSSIATLDTITTDVGNLTPSFSSSVTDYTVVVPSGTSTVNLTTEKTDDASTVSGDNAITLSGSETVTSFVVTAEDNSTTQTYKITFVVEDATLVHSYTFDTDTSDVIGTADGTLNGNATVENGALVLDEDGDYISFDGTELGLNDLSSITFEYMYTPSVSSNGGHWNWSSYFGNSDASNDIHVGFNVWTQLAIVVDNDNGGFSYWPGEGTGIGQSDKNYHLVITITDSSTCTYLDGELLFSTTTPEYTIGTAEAFIGKGSDAWSDATWLGSVDEFNIYEGVMSLETIESKADDYLNTNDATLSAITASAGTLYPEFESTITHYALVVPEGTASVDIEPTPTVSTVNVDYETTVDLSGGETTDTIVVTTPGETATKTYTIDVIYEDGDCFSPLYTDRDNIVSDPELTDLDSFALGWGAYAELIYGLNAYCGPSSAEVPGECTGTFNVDLVGLIEANSVYRMKAIAKVDSSGRFKVGFWGTGMSEDVIGTKSLNEWEVLDTVFATDATIGSDIGMYFNSCESYDGETGYIDNWELYKVDVDATLSDLLMDGTTIDGFDSGTLTYDVVLPEGTTTVPAFTASSNDGSATISYDQASSLPDTATVTVTSTDGVTTYSLTYTLYISVYETSSDATLSDIQLDGTTINGFNAETLKYDTLLAAGTSTVPVVTATATDDSATIVITQATSLTDSATIVVTAEDETKLTYTIYFDVYVQSSDATLSDLQVDGTTIDGFDAGTQNYSVELAAETTDVPSVTAEATDDSAKVTITDASELPGTTKVIVTAEDGSLKTYVVDFTLATSGVSDVSGIKNQVYPTSSTGDFIVTTTENVDLITVYDLKGEIVVQQNVTSNKQTINISENGIYIINVSGDNISESFRVMKTN